MPCRSIFSGSRQESSQKLYSTGWTDGTKKSIGALDVLCSREHVLVDLNSSSAPVEPTLQNQSTGALDVLCSRELVWVGQWTSSAPVEPMSLRSMHRCNDASLYTVSEPPTAIIWTQRDRLNRCFQFLTCRFFRWSRFFCSGLPTAMWPSPLYIRAPHGSIQLPLTP